MRAMILIGGLVALAAVVVLVGCQKAGESAAPAAGSPAPAAGTPAPGVASGVGAAGMPAQKFCPVMGNPIKPSVYVDHAGRRIYFCCPLCVNTFKQNPEKYIKKVDEEL